MNNDWRKCLLLGDSKDIIKRIPDNSIDLILTDPPYNIGKHSTGNIPLPGRSAINNDVADWDLVAFNPEEWAEEFIRILKPTGNLFIFTSYNQLGKWYDCLDHRFDTTNFMIWHKTNPAPKIFKAGFLNSCEMIFTCWNRGHIWNFISQAEMHNFIESPICMRPERLSTPKHPTQKPVSILKKMIEIASNPDDIIFDPFMGVGSTGVASLELNRKFIGVEINSEYFTAAKHRIETLLSNDNSHHPIINTPYNMVNDAQQPHVSDVSVPYLASLFDFRDSITQEIIPLSSASQEQTTGLQPLIKWPGGKEKELKFIIPNLPEFKRYFEPFVGGGSVFMAIRAEEYFINDFSEELIALYDNISTGNDAFFHYAEVIDLSWEKMEEFYHSRPLLNELYIQYQEDKITLDELKHCIKQFCTLHRDDIIAVVNSVFNNNLSFFCTEVEKNLTRKMTRMKVIEKEKGTLPLNDISDNIETALKSALYMLYRHLYNDKSNKNLVLRSALFYFLRNYAYSGMFRYSRKGDFNVPYGGIAYNSKLMRRKLEYFKSLPLLEHFANAHIFNQDFESFLRQTAPTEDDFIFLDPPYDSEFSTYAQHSFTREDHIRLANYLLHDCKAKWMLIIKNTDFIYSLYDEIGINIQSFDKEYNVSFMNRNNRKVTHLLIRNY